MRRRQRRLPAFDSLDCVRRTPQQQVRDGAQRGEMLDRQKTISFRDDSKFARLRNRNHINRIQNGATILSIVLV